MHFPSFEKQSASQNESIYPPQGPSRGPRYKSIYSNKVRVDEWCKKTGCHSTMGVPPTYLYKPREYLRKHSRQPPAFIDPEVLRSDISVRHEPTVESSLSMKVLANSCPQIERGDRDFLTENALRVTRTLPRKQKRFYLGDDGRFRVDLTDAPFILRPGFGEVPPYLSEIKKKLFEEEMRTKWNKQIGAKYRLLEHKERCQLVQNLKSRWDELNTEFLKLPETKTDHSERKKVNLETKLKEIEENLRLLQSKSPIFVENDEWQNLSY